MTSQQVNNNNNTNQTSEYLAKYLATNLTNICRLCLEKNNKLTPIFDPVKPPHFSLLIMACASVQVRADDGLPPSICQRCISRLNLAFQFKMQCESSDLKLRRCLENRFDTSQTEYLEHDKRDDDNCPNNVQNSQENVKVEPRESKAAYDNDMTNYEVYDGSSSIIKCPDSRNKERKPPKTHQCNTCGKTFRTKPSLVHHVRIHTGERPYVCHLCQKRFINGGHLHTHMKTHTGERNHVCAACNKAFATTQQLTKHTIAIHTSERPYGCTYCPKRFASSSNLTTHIKVHTGEKNFHCEICGKTFSTKGQLQQHSLIHTGEKAFLCEFCNKRFSQKAHLMRHLRIHSKVNNTD